jgi:hypothetical protein
MNWNVTGGEDRDIIKCKPTNNLSTSFQKVRKTSVDLSQQTQFRGQGTSPKHNPEALHFQSTHLGQIDKGLKEK